MTKKILDRPNQSAIKPSIGGASINEPKENNEIIAIATGVSMLALFPAWLYATGTRLDTPKPAKPKPRIEDQKPWY